MSNPLTFFIIPETKMAARWEKKLIKMWRYGAYNVHIVLQVLKKER